MNWAGDLDERLVDRAIARGSHRSSAFRAGVRAAKADWDAMRRPRKFLNPPPPYTGEAGEN